MNDTVRARILEQIGLALETVAQVGGVVVEPGTLEDSQVAATVAGGKRVIEWAASDDATLEEDGAGPEEVLGGEAMAFVVAVLVHIPEAEVAGGLTFQQVAAGISADIYAAHSTGTYPGQWADNGTPLALKTDLLGGGGLSISDVGTRCVAHGFKVTYRHLYGDPTGTV